MCTHNRTFFGAIFLFHYLENYFKKNTATATTQGGVEGGGGAVALDVVRSGEGADQDPRLASRLRRMVAGGGNPSRRRRRSD